MKNSRQCSKLTLSQIDRSAAVALRYVVKVLCLVPLGGGCGAGGESSGDGMGSDGSTLGASASSTDRAETSTLDPGGTMTAESTAASSAADTTTDGTTDGTTGGSTDDTTGGSTDGTTGVVLDGCYEPADFPYAGALCGPPGMSCTVQVDESIDPSEYARNGAPSIVLDDACEPQVLYSVAQLGYFGHFARRTGPGAWDDEDTPFPVALGGLAYESATGETLALPYDGALGVTVWRRGGEGWVQEDTLPGSYFMRTRAVGQRGDGVLRAGLSTGDNALLHVQWDGSWASEPLADSTLAETIGLGPGGVPHFSYWAWADGAWQMFWVTPGSPPEPVSSVGSVFGLQVSENGIAVTPDGGGTPHLGFARRTLPGGLHEIVYATRDGRDDWSILTVASENPAFNEMCSQDPTGPGEQCEVDFIRLQPLDVVASDGGDVRIFYAEYHIMRTLQSSCSPGPGGLYCGWNTMVDNSTGTLHVAWPDAGSIGSAVVLEDRFIRSMTSTLDIGGRIHIAAYTGRDEFLVEYLRLGS